MSDVARVSRSSASVSSCMARAIARRARRTARPSASRRGAERWRGPAPRAAAGHPKARLGRSPRRTADRRGRGWRARLASASSRGNARKPNATFSSTVRCGNSAKSWNIRPTPRFSGGTNRLGPATSSSLISTRPVVGRSMPETMRSKRGLAAARRTQQADDLARADVEVDAVERTRPFVVLRDALEPYARCKGCSSTRTEARLRCSGGFQGLRCLGENAFDCHAPTFRPTNLLPSRAFSRRCRQRLRWKRQAQGWPWPRARPMRRDPLPRRHYPPRPALASRGFPAALRVCHPRAAVRRASAPRHRWARAP